VLIKNRIPASQYPEQIATMLANMRVRRSFTEAGMRFPGGVISGAKKILERAPQGEYLPILDAQAILNSFSVTVPRSGLLKALEEVRNVSVDYPVVAKIEHPEIIHKSDVGGVRLNIGSADELAEAVKDFLKRFPGAKGVYFQEQVPDGIELILGGTVDPQLGPSVMIGLGGIWVEIMKDVIFGFPPVGREEARCMINSLRCEPLLSGYRGKPGVNKDALADLVERISAIMLSLPEITEIDLNPVIYDPKRDAFVAADARIKKG
jgi:acetyltransferase